MIDQPPAIVQVLTDHGGPVGERLLVLDWLRREGIAVQIKGMCGSACLFLFDLPKDQVCVYNDAWLASHSSKFDGIHPESKTTMIWERGSAAIERGVRKCR